MQCAYGMAHKITALLQYCLTELLGLTPMLQWVNGKQWPLVYNGQTSSAKSLQCFAGELLPEEARAFVEGLPAFFRPVGYLLQAGPWVQKAVLGLLKSRGGNSLLVAGTTHSLRGSIYSDASPIQKEDRDCYQHQHASWHQASMAEAFAQGIGAVWIEDLVRFAGQPWGFDLSTLPPEVARRLVVAHGGLDSQQPVVGAHSMKRMQPALQLRVYPAGHHADYWLCDLEAQSDLLKVLLSITQ